MGAVGRRAAEYIRRTADDNDTSLEFELSCINLNRQTLWQWENDIAEPSGKALKRLAEAGYDVNFILTGRRTP